MNEASAALDGTLAALPGISSHFRPRGWLTGPHQQTVLPTVPPLATLTRWRTRALRSRSREWLLDCGAGVRLQAWHLPAARERGRAALLLHGWEGSADSSYVLGLAARLHAQDYELVRLNLRDHGATHHLNRELFHSCRLPEVIGAVQAAAERCRAERLYLAGFSLGGNFLLRVAASDGLPAKVAGVAAISPVLDPANAMLALERGWPVYERYFVRKWSRSLRLKQRAWPDDYDFRQLFAAPRLRPMTATLVRQHTSFPDMDAYLAGYAITGARLASLAAPAGILQAEDDPIIPVADLARLAPGPRLCIERSMRGGHCGFLPRFGAESYANDFTVAQFQRFAGA